MSTRYTALATELVTALRAELAGLDRLVFDRRLQPRLDRTEFEADKIYVSAFVGAAAWEIIARQADRQQWHCLLAIQSALPDSEPPETGNPFGAVNSVDGDPVAWGDDVFEHVERVKDLFRAETPEMAAGALRDQTLAGCYFLEMLHDPVYVPAHLDEIGILTSVLSLTYRVLDPDEDE
jgi:hypothetical protein